MGTKSNWFLLFVLAHAILARNINSLTLFFLLSGFIALYKDFKVWKYIKEIPGQSFSSNWKTLFGNSSKNFHHNLDNTWKAHGRDKFITWIGFERFITVSKLSDIQAILNVTEEASFVDNYQQMWPWLGGDDVIKTSEFSSRGLIDALIDGPFCAFTQSSDFVKALNQRIGMMCQQSITKSDVIDVQPVIRSMTFDIVLGLALGRESSKSQQKLYEACEKLCQMADQRIYSGWKQNKWLLSVLGEESKVTKCHNVLAECVKKVLNEKRDDSGRRVECLLDALLADSRLTQKEIVSTLTGFIVLGFDRLSSATCLAMMELSKQLEIQENLQTEQKRVSSVETVEALKSFKVLDRFLLEVQRLNPAVSVIAKWITTGVPRNGFFIPPNSSVLFYLHGTGRDSHRFYNPDNFDVSRKNLSDAFGEDKHELNLPMTVMKVLVSNLLKKYSFKAEGESEIGCGLTLRPDKVRVMLKSF